MRPARHQGGFTPIELLVVVAVTTELISLLLPALSAARAAARSAICLSNQRRIGLALMHYAAAEKKYIPRESGDSEQLPAHAAVLVSLKQWDDGHYRPNGEP